MPLLKGAHRATQQGPMRSHLIQSGTLSLQYSPLLSYAAYSRSCADMTGKRFGGLR